MTRITERSPYYPDGVRRTSTTAATHFLPDLMPDGTLNSIYARPVHDCQLGGIVPSMGSIELAYEEGTWECWWCHRDIPIGQHCPCENH